MEQDSRIRIVAPDDSHLSAALCNPAEHPAFKPLFELPRFAILASQALDLSEYAVDLKNESDERIMALTVIWDYPHPLLKGFSKTVLRCDAYFLEGNNAVAVIAPRSHVLIHPKRILSAALLDCEHPVIFSSEGRINGLLDIDILKEAPRVTVTLDTIIFESGQVLGPDQSKTVDCVRNRKEAATAIVRLYRRAVEDDLDIDGFLQSLSAGRNGEYGSYDFWIHNFAHSLNHGPRLARPLTLMQYENLPKLPVFNT